MFDNLIKELKKLNLIHYKNIEETNNHIVLTISNKPNSEYQLIAEIIKIIDIIDKEIYTYDYNDEENKMVISKK